MKLHPAPILALVLAACASSPPEPPPTRPPPPQISTRPPPPQPRPNNSDTCGAHPLQYLVGRSRTEIPVPVNVTNRRVTCTTCPVTMDFREDRLNIFFDADTGIIKEVKCG